MNIIEQAKAELPFFESECLHFTLEARRALDGEQIVDVIPPLRSVIEQIKAARTALIASSVESVDVVEELDLRLAELERDLEQAFGTLSEQQSDCTKSPENVVSE